MTILLIVTVIIYNSCKSLALCNMKYEKFSKWHNSVVRTWKKKPITLAKSSLRKPVKINLSSAEARLLSELFQCALVYELHYSHVYGFILKLRSPSHWKPLYLFRTFSAWGKESFISCRITTSTHKYMLVPCTHTFCLWLSTEWSIHLAVCLFIQPLALKSPPLMGSKWTNNRLQHGRHCLLCYKFSWKSEMLFKAKNVQRL